MPPPFVNHNLTALQVDPETRPSTIGPPNTGHFRVTADTPRGLQPFQPAPRDQVTEGKPHLITDRSAGTAPPSKASLTHEGRRNVYEPRNGKDVTPAETKEGAAGGDANGTLSNSLKEKPIEYKCQICGNDCTAIRYHSGKTTSSGTKDYNICPHCLLDNRFPGDMNKSDFEKRESSAFPAIADSEAPWSETEELLLLEGLEMSSDDWNKISEHVGSRTREECVLKFLQMEIEDQYLEPEPAADPVSDGVGALSYLAGGRVPFSQADNPVLATMSYLVGLADPNTTAAAAGKAVAEVRKTMRARLEKAGSSEKGKEKEGSAPSSSVKAEGAMDVDDEAANDDVVAVRDANPTTTLPFALSAARAGGLASHEERTLTRLIHTATNLQMEKLELKQKQFAELEALISAERRDLERRRQQLFLDRLQFQRRVKQVEEAFSRACSISPQDGLKIVREAVGAGSVALVVKKVDASEGGEVGPVDGKSFEI